MLENILYAFIILIVFGLLFCFYLNYRKIERNKKGLNKHHKDAISTQKNEVLKKLNLIDEQNYLLALAYCIYCKVQELGLEADLTDRLYQEYGKQLSFPVIYWTKEFSFLNLNYYLLDESIAVYLKDKKYNDDKELEETDRFDNYIQANAMIEAEKIIKELL